MASLRSKSRPPTDGRPDPLVAELWAALTPGRVRSECPATALASNIIILELAGVRKERTVLSPAPDSTTRFGRSVDQTIEGERAEARSHS